MSKKIVDIKSEFENAAREEWQTLFEEYASDERSGVKNLIFSYQKKQIAYEKELLRLETMLAFEKKYGDEYECICGIDEAGRGDHNPHCEKHLSSIERGAACKRLNMYLRWMVRRDARGVDFGLWPSIPMSALYLPLDVHTGEVARALGLLRRRQNDWRAVEEVTAALRTLDACDPVRYDFALFGAGMDGFA